ncbi:hypothetical protein C8J56DRAFT_123110 [Mycena floridula]|nr:hypothetical protein C8J56DRAFT_123110 [Mycena floridula]
MTQQFAFFHRMQQENATNVVQGPCFSSNRSCNAFTRRIVALNESLDKEPDYIVVITQRATVEREETRSRRKSMHSIRIFCRPRRFRPKQSHLAEPHIDSFGARASFNQAIKTNHVFCSLRFCRLIMQGRLRRRYDIVLQEPQGPQRQTEIIAPIHEQPRRRALHWRRRKTNTLQQRFRNPSIRERGLLVLSAALCWVFMKTPTTLCAQNSLSEPISRD